MSSSQTNAILLNQDKGPLGPKNRAPDTYNNKNQRTPWNLCLLVNLRVLKEGGIIANPFLRKKARVELATRLVSPHTVLCQAQSPLISVRANLLAQELRESKREKEVFVFYVKVLAGRLKRAALVSGSKFRSKRFRLQIIPQRPSTNSCDTAHGNLSAAGVLSHTGFSDSGPRRKPCRTVVSRNRLMRAEAGLHKGRSMWICSIFKSFVEP